MRVEDFFFYFVIDYVGEDEGYCVVLRIVELQEKYNR